MLGRMIAHSAQHLLRPVSDTNTAEIVGSVEVESLRVARRLQDAGARG